MVQQTSVWVGKDSATVRKVQDAFPEAVQGVEAYKGQTTLTVDKDAIAEVARFLRDDEALQYNLLMDLTGVDYLDLGVGPRFAVIYHLVSISNNRRVRLKVPVEEFDPVLPSVTDVWSTANWHERETFDMFGLRFEGHPDLRRILNPEDWDGHPLRKDYPLGYEEIAFTHNYEEIYARKPHPEE